MKPERSAGWKAYERPESEVTGNKADDYVRRAPGTAGMGEGVRYQIYEPSDGHVPTTRSFRTASPGTRRRSTAPTCCPSR